MGSPQEQPLPELITERSRRCCSGRFDIMQLRHDTNTAQDAAWSAVNSMTHAIIAVWSTALVRFDRGALRLLEEQLQKIFETPQYSTAVWQFRKGEADNVGDSSVRAAHLTWPDSRKSASRDQFNGDGSRRIKYGLQNVSTMTGACQVLRRLWGVQFWRGSPDVGLTGAICQ
jgi:hypothetical protein